MSSDRALVFNKGLNALITRLERKSRSDAEVGNLERIKRRLTLLKSTLGVEEPLKLAAPIFTEFAERIIDPDAAKRDEFFLTFDVRAEYIARRGRIERDDEPVFALIDSIKKHYAEASRTERDAAVAEVKILLTPCLQTMMDRA